MEEWKEYKLEELLTIKYGKNQKDVESSTGNIPIYGTGGLMGYATKSLYEKPSILIGRKGTIDKVKFVDHPFWTVDTLFYSIINEEIVLPKFLYYKMSSINFMNYNEGTTIPSLRTETLNRLVFEIPPLPTQQKIAQILSSLDDKIELNNKINDNLEQQAQTIFKSWFVDDSSDLSEVTISEMDILVTDYVANGSFKDLADNVKYLSEETNNVLIRLTDYNNNYSSDMVYISDKSYEFLEKSKLTGDEIIISNVGVNVGTVFRCPRLEKRMSLAPNSIMIRAGIYEHYLYLYFTSDYGQGLLKSIVTGSAQPKFNKTNFRSLKITIPSKERLESFDKIYSPIYEQIVINQNENKKLSTLRDTLLPKLMNGEIEV